MHQDINEKIVICLKGQIHVVDKNDILYVYSSKRKIYIKTASGTLSCYQKLDDFEMELNDERFLRIHKSTLVNVGIVKKIIGNRMYVEGDEVLNISRGYIDSVKDYLLSVL